MQATFTDTQLEIERTVLAMSEGGLSLARQCYDKGWSEPPFDQQLLSGFGGLGLAEAGSNLVDLAVAVEALARRVTPSRLTAHTAALQLASGSGLDLTDAISGTVRWAPAVDEPGASGPAAFSTQLSGGRVRGAKTLVAHGPGADALVVTLADGVALVGADGARDRAAIDASRPFADVTLDCDVIASGPLGDGLLRATVVAAADLCGCARGAIELGAAYVRTREQFGKPIGSFQGVAFQLVEAFVGLKAAWDLTLYAAWAVDEGTPDAAAHVHAAKARAGQAAVFAAERTIQVHGGMGITWEADPHLYLRRALTSDAWLGTGAWHRRRLGQLRLAGRHTSP